MKGADCYGLARLITTGHYGHEMPPLGYEYDSTTDLTEMGESVKLTIDRYIRLDAPEEGCIVLIKVKNIECHIGIVISDKLFMHTLGGHDSCVERLDSKHWEKRIEGFYTWH